MFQAVKGGRKIAVFPSAEITPLTSIDFNPIGESNVKALLSPRGLFIFVVLEGGVIERRGAYKRGGGLFLTLDKRFIEMFFCIPSALFPLKNQWYQLRKSIYSSQL